MHDTLDFTYDEETYAELPSLVEDLHRHEQKYIIIIVSLCTFAYA